MKHTKSIRTIALFLVIMLVMSILPISVFAQTCTIKKVTSSKFKYPAKSVNYYVNTTDNNRAIYCIHEGTNLGSSSQLSDNNIANSPYFQGLPAGKQEALKRATLFVYQGDGYADNAWHAASQALFWDIMDGSCFTNANGSTMSNFRSNVSDMPWTSHIKGLISQATTANADALQTAYNKMLGQIKSYDKMPQFTSPNVVNSNIPTYSSIGTAQSNAVILTSTSATLTDTMGVLPSIEYSNIGITYANPSDTGAITISKNGNQLVLTRTRQMQGIAYIGLTKGHTGENILGYIFENPNNKYIQQMVSGHLADNVTVYFAIQFADVTVNVKKTSRTNGPVSDIRFNIANNKTAKWAALGDTDVNGNISADIYTITNLSNVFDFSHAEHYSVSESLNENSEDIHKLSITVSNGNIAKIKIAISKKDLEMVYNGQTYHYTPTADSTKDLAKFNLAGNPLENAITNNTDHVVLFGNKGGTTQGAWRLPLPTFQNNDTVTIEAENGTNGIAKIIKKIKDGNTASISSESGNWQFNVYSTANRPAEPSYWHYDMTATGAKTYTVNNIPYGMASVIDVQVGEASANDCSWSLQSNGAVKLTFNELVPHNGEKISIIYETNVASTNNAKKLYTVTTSDSGAALGTALTQKLQAGTYWAEEIPQPGFAFYTDYPDHEYAKSFTVQNGEDAEVEFDNTPLKTELYLQKTMSDGSTGNLNGWAFYYSTDPHFARYASVSADISEGGTATLNLKASDLPDGEDSILDVYVTDTNGKIYSWPKISSGNGYNYLISVNEQDTRITFYGYKPSGEVTVVYQKNNNGTLLGTTDANGLLYNEGALGRIYVQECPRPGFICDLTVKLVDIQKHKQNSIGFTNRPDDIGVFITKTVIGGIAPVNGWRFAVYSGYTEALYKNERVNITSKTFSWDTPNSGIYSIWLEYKNGSTVRRKEVTYSKTGTSITINLASAGLSALPTDSSILIVYKIADLPQNLEEVGVYTTDEDGIINVSDKFEIGKTYTIQELPEDTKYCEILETLTVSQNQAYLVFAYNQTATRSSVQKTTTSPNGNVEGLKFLVDDVSAINTFYGNALHGGKVFYAKYATTEIGQNNVYSLLNSSDYSGSTFNGFIYDVFLDGESLGYGYATNNTTNYSYDNSGRITVKKYTGAGQELMVVYCNYNRNYAQTITDVIRVTNENGFIHPGRPFTGYYVEEIPYPGYVELPGQAYYDFSGASAFTFENHTEMVLRKSFAEDSAETTAKFPFLICASGSYTDNKIADAISDNVLVQSKEIYVDRQEAEEEGIIVPLKQGDKIIALFDKATGDMLSADYTERTINGNRYATFRTDVRWYVQSGGGEFVYFYIPAEFASCTNGIGEGREGAELVFAGKDEPAKVTTLDPFVEYSVYELECMTYHVVGSNPQTVKIGSTGKAEVLFENTNTGDLEIFKKLKDGSQGSIEGVQFVITNAMTAEADSRNDTVVVSVDGCYTDDDMLVEVYDVAANRWYEWDRYAYDASLQRVYVYFQDDAYRVCRVHYTAVFTTDRDGRILVNDVVTGYHTVTELPGQGFMPQDPQIVFVNGGRTTVDFYNNETELNIQKTFANGYTGELSGWDFVIYPEQYTARNLPAYGKQSVIADGDPVQVIGAIDDINDLNDILSVYAQQNDYEYAEITTAAKIRPGASANITVPAASTIIKVEQKAKSATTWTNVAAEKWSFNADTNKVTVNNVSASTTYRVTYGSSVYIPIEEYHAAWADGYWYQEGVEIECISYIPNAGEELVVVYQRYDPNDAADRDVQIIMTDADGKASTENIAAGNYLVQEIPVPGYVYAEPKNVTLSAGSASNIIFENRPMDKTLEIKKEFETGSEGEYSDWSFLIYKNDENFNGLLYDHQVLHADGTLYTMDAGELSNDITAEDLFIYQNGIMIHNADVEWISDDEIDISLPEYCSNDDITVVYQTTNTTEYWIGEANEYGYITVVDGQNEVIDLAVGEKYIIQEVPMEEWAYQAPQYLTIRAGKNTATFYNKRLSTSDFNIRKTVAVQPDTGMTYHGNYSEFTFSLYSMDYNEDCRRYKTVDLTANGSSTYSFSCTDLAPANMISIYSGNTEWAPANYELVSEGGQSWELNFLYGTPEPGSQITLVYESTVDDYTDYLIAEGLHVNSSGVLNIDGVQPGQYVIEEMPIRGYKYQPAKDIEILTAKTNSVTFTNEPLTPSIVLQKTIADGMTGEVAGWQFAVTGYALDSGIAPENCCTLYKKTEVHGENTQNITIDIDDMTDFNGAVNYLYINGTVYNDYTVNIDDDELTISFGRNIAVTDVVTVVYHTSDEECDYEIYTSDENGHIAFTVSPNNFYIIEEIPQSGYAYTEPQVVTVENAQFYFAQFVNTPLNVPMEIHKEMSDGSTDNLGGWKFYITSSSNVSMIYNGTNIEYTKNEDIYDLTLADDIYNVVYVYSGDKVLEDWEYEYNDETGRDQIDFSGTSGLTDGDIITVVCQVVSDSYLDSLTVYETDENGIINEHFPAGEYVVTEIPVSEYAYQPAQMINLSDGNNTVTFVNTPFVHLGLKVIKTLAEGSTGSVSGWHFDVYQGNVLIAEDQVTNTDGEILISDIEEGTYRICEHSVDGWAVQSEQTVTVTAENTVDNPAEVTFENEQIFVRIIKTLAAGTTGSVAGWQFMLTKNGTTYGPFTTGADGTITANIPAGTYTVHEVTQTGWNVQPDQTITITDANTYEHPATVSFENSKPALRIVKAIDEHSTGSVAGWVFDVYQGDTVVAENVVTNADGEIFISNLLAGTYTVHEHSVEGWVEQNDKTVVVATANTVSNPAEVTFENEQTFVKIIKTLATGTTGSISGWQFTLTKNGTTYGPFTTESDGTITVNIPAGTYTVHEVAQTGWAVQPDQTVTVTNANTYSNPASVAFTNEKLALRIIKTIDENSTGSVEGWLFDIYQGNTLIVSGAETNADGEIFIPNLLAGTYTVHEHSVEGWVEQNDKTVVVATANTVSNPAEVTFENEQTFVKIIKTLATGTTGSISGWQFTLTKNGTTYGPFTTESDGTITVNIPAGTYTVHEVVQTGWAVQPDQTVTVTNANTYSNPASVAFTNEKLALEIVKTIADGSTGSVTGWVFDVYQGNTLIAGNLVTGADGRILVSNLLAGTYTVHEHPVNGWVEQEDKVVRVLTTNTINNPAYAPFENRQITTEFEVVKTIDGTFSSDCQNWPFRIYSTQPDSPSAWYAEQPAGNNTSTYTFDNVRYGIYDASSLIEVYVDNALWPAAGENSYSASVNAATESITITFNGDILPIADDTITVVYKTNAYQTNAANALYDGVTSANGKIVRGGLHEHETYYIEELPQSGYAFYTKGIAWTGFASVETIANETASVTFDNAPLESRLLLKKTIADDSSGSVAGWQFTISDGNTSHTFTTGNNGYIAVNGLAAGTYTITEAQKDGWLVQEPQTVTISNFTTAMVSFENEQAGSVKIVKQIAGASSTACNNWQFMVYSEMPENRSYDFDVIDATGNMTYEIDTTDYYDGTSASIIGVYMRENDIESAWPTAEYTFIPTETAYTSELAFTSACAPNPGSEIIVIYKTSAYDSNVASDTYLGTYTTKTVNGEPGVISITNLVPGTYYVEEVPKDTFLYYEDVEEAEAVSGTVAAVSFDNTRTTTADLVKKELTSGSVGTVENWEFLWQYKPQNFRYNSVTATANGTDTYQLVAPQVTVDGTVYSYKFNSIVEVYVNNSLWPQSNYTFTKTSDTTATIKFTGDIIPANGETITVVYRTQSNSGNRIQYTDENGYAFGFVSNANANVEEVPQRGYIYVAPQPYTVKGNRVNTFRFENTPLESRMLLKKTIDEDSEGSVEGWEFTISNGSETYYCETDENGYIDLKDIPAGTYTVHETPAEDWVVQPDQTIVVKPYETAFVTFENKVAANKVGKIEIFKTDSNDAPIENVEFMLQYSTDNGTTWNTVTTQLDPVEDEDRIGECGTTTSDIDATGHILTDTNGVAAFDMLYTEDDIQYRIVETATAPGKVLLQEPVVIPMPKTLTFESAAEMEQWIATHQDLVDWFDVNEDDLTIVLRYTKVEIVNHDDFELPVTGENGLTFVTFATATGLLAFAVLMILLKKKKITE